MPQNLLDKNELADIKQRQRDGGITQEQKYTFSSIHTGRTVVHYQVMI
jgi:hypothetical protein